MTEETFYYNVTLNALKTPRLSTVYRHSGRDWQDAESILFIHGSLASGRWWEPAMASFEELMPSKYACYAPDLRSHGEADPLPVTGMESFTLDLLSVMDAIGLKRAHIVGWSMGGGPAMLLALDYPERCLSLSLVSALSPSGAGASLVPANRVAIGAAIGRGEIDTLARFIRAGSLREGRFPLDNSPPGNALFYYLLQSVLQVQNYPGDEASQEGNGPAMRLFNVAGRCAGVSMPVLSVHGDSDATLTKDYFAGARQPWPAQLFQEVIFAGGGHSPMVEQPRRFALTLDEFFAAV